MVHLFIVGAQRSGSTYLYRLLQDHPEIRMAQPVRPEPKYFLSEELYSRGRRFYESSYFSDYPLTTRYLGEKSTSYIESMMAAERINHFYPDARILMILRDPVQRAWSNYRFSFENGLESLDFETALGLEQERVGNKKYGTSVSPYAYRQRGHYINYIKDYLKVFNTYQICVLVFEEFVGNITCVQDLYGWLGVDDTFIPASLGKVFNSSNTQNEMPISVSHDLVAGYKKSLVGLEEFLGRQINVWRQNWESQ